MRDWLELLEEPGHAAGCPLRMRSEWETAFGRLRCARCRQDVLPGELFALAGRCAMGGEVALGSHGAAYADVLEPVAEHLRCRAEAEGRSPSVCLTIGHGTRPIEAFLELLREAEVEVLADVRTVPRSRHNPQFAREALAPALGAAGICYLHLPELGGLRKPRPDSPNAGWRNESFRGYADYMLTDRFRVALDELVALLRLRTTALMCAETVYWRCHRSLIADALLARGLEARHLMDAGKSVPHALTKFGKAEGERVYYPAGG